MCAFTACVRFLRRRGPAGLRNLFFDYSVVIFAPPHADTAELAFCAIMGIIRIEILGGEECVWAIR